MYFSNKPSVPAKIRCRGLSDVVQTEIEHDHTLETDHNDYKWNKWLMEISGYPRLSPALVCKITLTRGIKPCISIIYLLSVLKCQKQGGKAWISADALWWEQNKQQTMDGTKQAMNGTKTTHGRNKTGYERLWFRNQHGVGSRIGSNRGATNLWNIFGNEVTTLFLQNRISVKLDLKDTERLVESEVVSRKMGNWEVFHKRDSNGTLWETWVEPNRDYSLTRQNVNLFCFLKIYFWKKIDIGKTKHWKNGSFFIFLHLVKRFINFITIGWFLVIFKRLPIFAVSLDRVGRDSVLFRGLEEHAGWKLFGWI